MKCLFCFLCGDLVAMRLGIFRECACGNVGGRYAPNESDIIEISIKDPVSARVVGIDNNFLRENDVPLDNPIYKDTLFKQLRSHIVMIIPFTTGDVRALTEV